MSILELADVFNEIREGRVTPSRSWTSTAATFRTSSCTGFEQYAAGDFSAFGMELDSPATADTPRRFVRRCSMRRPVTRVTPNRRHSKFETECRGGPDWRLSQVIRGPIQFYALCEHHAP